MLFDEKYDKSLWLMLSGDKRNRKEMSDFLKAIPKTVYELIKTGIKEYNEHDCGENIFNYEKTLKVSDRLSYFFGIDSEGTIFIIKNYKNGSIDDYHMLEIIPFEKYLEYGTFDEIHIGNFTYCVDRGEFGSDVDDVSYGLVKLPFGNSMITSFRDRPSLMIYSRFKPINVENVPDEIYTEDLVSEECINRLVRRFSKKRN